jgi:hypothetical protein
MRLVLPFRRVGFRSSFDESIPQYALLLPVWQDRNCAYFALAEAGDVVGGGFKVEDRFLDVRGELGEVDDLRYASTGDAAVRAISAWSLTWPLASRCSSRMAKAISLVM